MGTLLLLNMVRFILIGLELAVFARVVLSFVNPAGRGAIAGYIISTTEPLLAPVRKVLPRSGMFDFSPLIVCLVIGALLRAVA
ncbi:MAG TPA: YggT family protein [Patescibacteria group bacterium]|nr:YggT family protein [Patescibacteria group bacterium]